MILIIYTTQYRKGGAKFERVAKTLAKELGEHRDDVVFQATESKQEVRKLFFDLQRQSKKIDELHFIGHSGMYGPMFGTVKYPEQFSPHEWKNLEIPFSEKGEAYFHCCRSARWFSPFFSRVFGVPTSGYHWYTVFSQKKDRFKVEWGEGSSDNPLYCFGHIGKKSHGYGGSFKKYLGLTRPEKMKRFEVDKNAIDETYNTVASLYDDVFQDIRVRQDEWGWLSSNIKKGGNVLDIGCGNGALLKQFSSFIEKGVGVDESEELLRKAEILNSDCKNISFTKINGPELPFEDHSFDTVTSLLSFRYLDWDPIMNEIIRVLKPDGRLLIVDMVTAPVKTAEYPKLLTSKFRHYNHRKKYPAYYKALSRLVAHPGWKNMLKYNPIRSQHEMKWYLESRFPGAKVEIINIGWNARVIAFRADQVAKYQQVELTYP